MTATNGQPLPKTEELLSSANVVSAPKGNNFGTVRRSNKVLNRSTVIAIGVILVAVIVSQSGLLGIIWDNTAGRLPAANATSTPPPAGNVSSLLQRGENSNAQAAAAGTGNASGNGTGVTGVNGVNTGGNGAQNAAANRQANENLNVSMENGINTMRNNSVNQPLVTQIHANQGVNGVDPNTLMRQQNAAAANNTQQQQQTQQQVPAPSNDNSEILVASAVSQNGPSVDFGSSNIPVQKSDTTGNQAVSPSDLRSNSTLQFIATGSGSVYHSANEAPPAAAHEVFASTKTFWRLTATIDTTHPGYIWAELQQPIRDSFAPCKGCAHPIIFPVKTTLRGRADTNVATGDTSVTVSWDLCTLPNGYTCDLGGMQGQDPDGRNGLSGQVNNHSGRIYTTVFLGTLLTAAAAAGNTGGTLSPSAGASISGAAAGNLTNTANAELQKNLNIPAGIVVPEGKDFTIIIESTLVNVRPYSDLTQPDH